MTAIRIPKRGMELAGLLFHPPAPAASLSSAPPPLPAIVVVHPGGGVKEQCAADYARLLAERGGYVTVAYDSLHQGESDGTPHFLEDPASRVSDISAVVSYLQSPAAAEALALPPGGGPGVEVDPDRISVFGICAGGGYSINCAMGDRRIRRLAVVSVCNIGDVARKGWFNNRDPARQAGETLDKVAGVLTAEARARARGGGGEGSEGSEGSSEGEGTIVDYIETGPDEPESVCLDSGRDYYARRAAHPRALAKCLVASAPAVLTFDAWNLADAMLSQPLLVMWGAEAESAWSSEAIAAKVRGGRLGTPVREVAMPGARHMDLYDTPEYVDRAVAEALDWFGQEGEGEDRARRVSRCRVHGVEAGSEQAQAC